jgi:hypothetical protein
MLPILRRHPLRLAIALAAVLVLTRLPSIGFAEDAYASSVKIQESVVMPADVVPDPVGTFVLPPRIVPCIEAFSESGDSKLSHTRQSILRL